MYLPYRAGIASDILITDFTDYPIKVAVKRPAHAISYLLTSYCIVENIAAMSH